jgi:hypothetical protein
MAGQNAYIIAEADGRPANRVSSLALAYAIHRS